MWDGVGLPPEPKVNKSDKLEKDVEARFVRICKKRGYHSWKFVSVNNRGVSDRIIIASGRVVFVELKRSKGKMSPLQKVFRKKVVENEGEFVCLYGDEGVDKFFRSLDCDVDVWESLMTAVRSMVRIFKGEDLR